MAHYSVATAKDGLSRLIAKAEAGEEVIITRHGKPAVELRAVEARKCDRAKVQSVHDWLIERRRSRPSISISSVELVRLDREESQH